MTMRLAEVDGKPLVHEHEDKLTVVLEADDAAALGGEASRKFAYEKRGQFGFGSAGIDSCSGCYTVTGADGKTVFRREVTLFRSPI